MEARRFPEPEVVGSIPTAGALRPRRLHHGRLAQWKSARSAYGRSRVRTPQCPFNRTAGEQRWPYIYLGLSMHPALLACGHISPLRILKWAALAQLGERQTEDLKVPGSIPGGGTFSDGAVVPKRLRGWTRNPLGSARAGSSPADCEFAKVWRCRVSIPVPLAC